MMEPPKRAFAISSSAKETKYFFQEATPTQLQNRK